MESTLEKYLLLSGKIDIAIMMLPIIVAVFFRKYLNQSLIILLSYCLISIAINLLEHTFVWAVNNYPDLFKESLKYWGIGDTNFLQILYYLKDFIFLGWFYYILMPAKYRPFIKIVTIILCLSSIINYLFIEGYNVYGTFNPAADAFYSFLLPSFFLWYLYKNMLQFPISKNPYFWLSFGLVFTNLVGLFLYLVGDTVHEADYALFLKLSIARNIFDMIAQIILALGFWYAPYIKYIPLPVEEIKQA